MRLGFWNNGSPKETDPKRVRFPDGNVIYDAAPDPSKDLYEMVSATEPPCHPWQNETLTYELINNVITQKRACSWPLIGALKTRKKAQISSYRFSVSSERILIGTHRVWCTDGTITEIETLLNQAERGKVTFPVKTTTSEGEHFVLANIGELQAILDAIHVHRQAARNTEYDHLVAVENLVDELSVADYDHTTNWPPVVGKLV